MAQTTPKHSGYTIINGSTTGSNGAKVNTWLEYKATKDIASNTSTVDVYLYARANVDGLGTSWDGTRSYGSITFDGTSHAGASISGYDFRHDTIYNEFAHYSQTVTHDSTGKKTITLAGSWNKGASPSSFITGGSVPSTSVTLPTIPRYATVSQSLGGKTETGITVKWSSDSTIDYVWYSINNGSSWTAVGSVNATSGSYTISGLSANTSYNIKTRVRRKDSQLTTDSSAMSQTTYNYPYATSMPNFTIGNTLTIGLYNPLGRTVTVSIIGADNSECSRDDTSGTSITGYTYSGIVNALYRSIPNAKNGTYKVKVTYGTSVITQTGGTYSTNASACTPTIGSLTYQDTKTATVNITEDNQKIVRNQSTVRYTASGLSAKNSATISSVRVTVNGQTYNMTVSGTSATGGNAVINSGTNVTATVTLTDSRGYTGTKTVTVQMLDWQLPSALITLQRQNNYYTPTSLKANCTYSSLNSKNTITITYKAKKQGSGSWELTGSLTNNVATTIQCDNEYDWDVQVIITDRLGTTTYNTTLSRGTPIIYFDKQRGSTGFNGFPAIDNGVDFQGNVLPAINGKPFVAEAKGFALFGGTQIPNNSDLNDDVFIGAGTWWCNANADAQTLSNCPTNYGFRMIVMKTLRPNETSGSGYNWNVSLQTIYDYWGNIYTRYIGYMDDAITKRVGDWQIQTYNYATTTEANPTTTSAQKAYDLIPNNSVGVVALRRNGATEWVCLVQRNSTSWGSVLMTGQANQGTKKFLLQNGSWKPERWFAEEFYNDTGGSTWQEMVKNKIDYVKSNYPTGHVYILAGGWSGQEWGYSLVNYPNSTHISIDFYGIGGMKKYHGYWDGTNYSYKNLTVGELKEVTGTSKTYTASGSDSAVASITLPQGMWLVSTFVRCTGTVANSKFELYYSNFQSDHRSGGWQVSANSPLYMQHHNEVNVGYNGYTLNVGVYHSGACTIDAIYIKATCIGNN